MNKLKLKFYKKLSKMLNDLSFWSESKSQYFASKVVMGSIGTTLIDRALYKPKPDSELTVEQLASRKRLRDIQHLPEQVPTELPLELKIALATLNYTTDNNQNG